MSPSAPKLTKKQKKALAFRDRKGKGKGKAGREDVLKLWGLTLGMTLDLLALLHPPQRPKLPLEPDADGLIGLEMAPSMAYAQLVPHLPSLVAC